MQTPMRFGRRESRARILTLLTAAALLLGPPLVAKGKKKGPAEAAETAADRAKTLEQTVQGAEKIEGLLTFYRSPDKLYLVVPEAWLGQPMGFSAVLVQALGDFRMRGGAIDNQLVRWSRAGDHLTLTKLNLDFRADAASPMRPVLEASFPDSPVFSAALVELSDEEAPLLIEAGELFGPELARLIPERVGFSAKADGAILDSLRSFEDNVVARVIYRLDSKPSTGAGGEQDPFQRFLKPGRLADPRTAELTVDYNFYRLPDDGFQPRQADQRVGGWELGYKDYSDIEGRDTLFRHILRRWDVRKTDPQAALSPAAEPITFYMDPSIPDKWRPLVREGALWWNPAFEKVGIQDAIRVLDPPQDGEWDPADIRHSVIYWNLSDNLVFSGAAGPSMVDPRTGKVLKANVYLNGEFFSFALNRYLVYAWWRAPETGRTLERARARDEALRMLRSEPGFCDRAASFSSQIAFARLVLQSRGVLKPGTPEADRFAREAFLELVAHEFGHALGFPHNWKGSLIASWDDVAAGRVSGSGETIFSSSVMDYNPIYLAPRGKPQGDYFMRELGPYDDLAVEYLYRPLQHLSTEERSRELDRIAARAETEPGLIYDSGVLGGIDPTTNSDDYGDDPVAFAESRLAMVREEVLPRLSELVLAEGHDYSLLRQALDSAIFSVAMDYIDITARHVGGQRLLRRVAGSGPAGGPRPIEPIPAEVQRRAFAVLDRHVFADDAFAVSPETMALLKADMQYDWNYPWRFASDYDVGSRIAGLYDAAITLLLEPARLARVLDNERRLGPDQDAFTLPELFERLQNSALEGLDGSPISADRRALQRVLTAHLVALVLEPGEGTPAEASQLAARSLASMASEAASVIDDTEELDGYTHAHLTDLVRRANRTLEASVQLPVKR